MQSPAIGTICYDLENGCNYLADGDCDDGGAGADYASCPLGFDCADCGPRTQVLPPPMAGYASSPSPSPVDGASGPGDSPGTLCSDSCLFDSDGECDDGGDGASYGACELGTDCTDCGERSATSGRRLAADRAPLQAGHRSGVISVGLPEEAYKPQPPWRHQRSLQGCAAVSPSPPLPAPPPSSPLPLVPPLPPFPPIRSNETIMNIPVVTISIGIVLQGTLESLDRQDIHNRLKARVGCYDPCEFTTTFTQGSIVVTAEACVPRAQVAVASTVESSFNELTTGTTQSLGEVVGTKVQGLASPVVARIATKTQVVTQPSPPPPPQVPSPMKSASVPIGVIVGAAVGGVVAVACVCAIIWFIRRRPARQVKPVAYYS